MVVLARSALCKVFILLTRCQVDLVKSSFQRERPRIGSGAFLFLSDLMVAGWAKLICHVGEGNIWLVMCGLGVFGQLWGLDTKVVRAQADVSG